MGKARAASNIYCPECQSQMVLRSTGDGRQFYGCSTFPRCKGTRPYLHPLVQKLTPYFEEDLGDSDGASTTNEREKCDEFESANLVSSELRNRPGKHMVILDLDCECCLVPSSTPGHFHLYIDKVLGEKDLKALCDMLALVGVLQKGYVKRLHRDGCLFLRKPGVKK